jgi:hypothetical protein
VTLFPLDYLFIPFNTKNFPDLFDAIWVTSLVLLVVLVILYNVRTRRLHRHPPYLDLWEWLLWTGIITFSLLLIGSIFVFSFVLILLTAIIGIGTLLWIRFRRFPPILAAYDADRGPPLRRRPPAAGRAAGHDRHQRPGPPQRRPRPDQ